MKQNKKIMILRKQRIIILVIFSFFKCQLYFFEPVGPPEPHPGVSSGGPNPWNCTSIPDQSIMRANLIIRWKQSKDNIKKIVILVIFSYLRLFGPLLEPLGGPLGVPWRPQPIYLIYLIFQQTFFQTKLSPRFFISLFWIYAENSHFLWFLHFFAIYDNSKIAWGLQFPLNSKVISIN